MDDVAKQLPTAVGKSRYPGGVYEDKSRYYSDSDQTFACTCAETCAVLCTGTCGCEPCTQTWVIHTDEWSTFVPEPNWEHWFQSQPREQALLRALRTGQIPVEEV